MPNPRYIAFPILIFHSKATCSYAKKLFDQIDLRGGEGGERFHRMIVSAADTNGDAVVDFDEWFSKLKSFVTAAFDALDQDQDGSIFEEAQEGNILNSIPYRFFEELFNQLFDFIDSNNDGAMSLEDDFFVEMFHNARDRNEDGKMNLSEAFGLNLISLPAPIYNFYVKVMIIPKEISHDS